MTKSKVIGGEFAISHMENVCKSKIWEGYFYSSGRAALYNILLFLKTKYKVSVIYLPDYLCESVINVCNILNFKIIYYKIDEKLKINELDKFSDTKFIYFIVNYFGLADIKKIIQSIKDNYPDCFVIEDDVQAFYEMFEDSCADFKFTSFRKTFPVPDGAWVKTHYVDLPIAQEYSAFSMYKIAGSIIKYLRDSLVIDDDIYLKLLEKGEEIINSDLNSSMTSFSEDILSKLDFELIANIRKGNARFLSEQLLAFDIYPILDINLNKSVPLFFPVRLRCRDKIRMALFENQIYCPIHWPISQYESLERGKELSQNELSLVIDQRYNFEDMSRIISVIKKQYD